MCLLGETWEQDSQDVLCFQLPLGSEIWRWGGQATMWEKSAARCLKTGNSGSRSSLSFGEQETGPASSDLHHKLDGLKTPTYQAEAVSSLRFRVQVVAQHKDKGLHVPERDVVEFNLQLSSPSICDWSPLLSQRPCRYEDQTAKHLHTFKIHLTFLPPDPEQLQTSFFKSWPPLAIYLIHFFCHFLAQNEVNRVFFINFSFACLRPEYGKWDFDCLTISIWKN